MFLFNFTVFIKNPIEDRNHREYNKTHQNPGKEQGSIEHMIGKKQ